MLGFWVVLGRRTGNHGLTKDNRTAQYADRMTRPAKPSGGALIDTLRHLLATRAEEGLSELPPWPDSPYRVPISDAISDAVDMTECGEPGGGEVYQALADMVLDVTWSIVDVEESEGLSTFGVLDLGGPHVFPVVDQTDQPTVCGPAVPRSEMGELVDVGLSLADWWRFAEGSDEPVEALGLPPEPFDRLKWVYRLNAAIQAESESVPDQVVASPVVHFSQDGANRFAAVDPNHPDAMAAMQEALFGHLRSTSTNTVRFWIATSPPSPFSLVDVRSQPVLPETLVAEARVHTYWLKVASAIWGPTPPFYESPGGFRVLPAWWTETEAIDYAALYDLRLTEIIADRAEYVDLTATIDRRTTNRTAETPQD